MKREELSWGDTGGGYVTFRGERRFRQGADHKHKKHCGYDTERQDTWLFLSLCFCADEKDLSTTTGAKYIPSHCMATVAPLLQLKSKQTL